MKHLENISFSFKGKRSKYMYDDVKKFTSALYKKIRTSTVIKNNDITNYLPEREKTEHFSMERLEKICEFHKMKFEKNHTNGNYIDGYINGKSFQLKSTKRKSGLLHQANLSKKGSQVLIPYDETDSIDFFIFNIAVPKYENDFYIIPKFVLIDRGYLKTNEYSGHHGITLASSDYGQQYWTLEFINRFKLITELKLNPLLGKSTFEKACIKNKLEYKKSIDISGQLVISSINGKKLCFIYSAKLENEKGFYPVHFRRLSKSHIENDRKYKPYKDSDNIDIFIIEIDKIPNQVCIIPKQVLIDQGYMRTNKQRGHFTLPIFPPNCKSTEWSKLYWNNFSAF